MRSGRGKRK
jgi:hypothetical protein